MGEEREASKNGLTAVEIGGNGSNSGKDEDGEGVSSSLDFLTMDA